MKIVSSVFVFFALAVPSFGEPMLQFLADKPWYEPGDTAHLTLSIWNGDEMLPIELLEIAVGMSSLESGWPATFLQASEVKHYIPTFETSGYNTFGPHVVVRHGTATPPFTFPSGEFKLWEASASIQEPIPCSQFGTDTRFFPEGGGYYGAGEIPAMYIPEPGVICLLLSGVASLLFLFLFRLF